MRTLKATYSTQGALNGQLGAWLSRQPQWQHCALLLLLFTNTSASLLTERVTTGVATAYDVAGVVVDVVGCMVSALSEDGGRGKSVVVEL
jgi:hypothetical protein